MNNIYIKDLSTLEGMVKVIPVNYIEEDLCIIDKEDHKIYLNERTLPKFIFKTFGTEQKGIDFLCEVIKQKLHQEIDGIVERNVCEMEKRIKRRTNPFMNYFEIQRKSYKFTGDNPVLKL